MAKTFIAWSEMSSCTYQRKGRRSTGACLSKFDCSAEFFEFAAGGCLLAGVALVENFLE